MASSTMMSVPPTNTLSVRPCVEMLLVNALIFVGLILGGATGFVPLGPIMGMLVPLVAVTFFLHREGTSWRDLMFGERLDARKVIFFGLLSMALAYSLVILASPICVRVFGLEPTNIAGVQGLLEGNLMMYLWFLLPVVWGSVAIGEEMLMRGFFLHWFEGKLGTNLAILAQAALFAIPHSYQGTVGMISVFLLEGVWCDLRALGPKLTTADSCPRSDRNRRAHAGLLRPRRDAAAHLIRRAVWRVVVFDDQLSPGDVIFKIVRFGKHHAAVA